MIYNSSRIDQLSFILGDALKERLQYLLTSHTRLRCYIQDDHTAGKDIFYFEVDYHLWDNGDRSGGEGRITIPAQIRRALGIAKGEKLVISARDGSLILRRKKVVSVSDIKGIIGPLKVRLEDVEEAPGKGIRRNH